MGPIRVDVARYCREQELADGTARFENDLMGLKAVLVSWTWVGGFTMRLGIALGCL